MVLQQVLPNTWVEKQNRSPPGILTLLSDLPTQLVASIIFQLPLLCSVHILCVQLARSQVLVPYNSTNMKLFSIAVQIYTVRYVYGEKF